MFCENCGRELKDGARFCAYCGAAQGRQAAPVWEMPQQPAGYEQQPSPAPVPPTAPPPRRKKSKLPLVLAGIFLLAIAGAAVYFSVLRNLIRTDSESSTASSQMQIVNQPTEEVDESAAETEPTAEPESSPYGTPIETLDEFFNYGDDDGIIRSINSEELSLSVAYNTTKGIYAWFDTNGNIYYESPDASLSDFVGGRGMIRKTNSETKQNCCMLMVEDGTLKVDIPKGLSVGDKNNIICYSADSTGYTMWTVRKEDALDGSMLVFTAWDNDGNIKMQASTEEVEIENIGECYQTAVEKRDHEGMNYVCEAWYQLYTDYVYDSVYFNVETGEIWYSDESLTFEGDVIVCTKGGPITEYVTVMNRDGSIRFEATVNDHSEYNNGLIYMNSQASEDEPAVRGYYDKDGNMQIDLSQYRVVEAGTFNDDGLAVVKMLNPDGVYFYGVLKKDGTWLIEPQVVKNITCTNGIIAVESDNDLTLYDLDGNKIEGMLTEKKFYAAGFELTPKNAEGVQIGKIDFLDGETVKQCVVKIEDGKRSTCLASCGW